MALINKLSKNGFGQIEPNHLNAQRTGQVYAQLPVGTDITGSVLSGVVENGLFLNYDYGAGAVSLPTAGGSSTTMLVMNEVRLYADFLTPKDFAQISSGTLANIGLGVEAGTSVYPRVYKVNVGDIITTNLVAQSFGTGAATTGSAITDYAVGDVLSPNTNGILTKVTGSFSPAATVIEFKVAARTTTPDLQPALKLQCTKA
jgi:hypothetical protein